VTSKLDDVLKFHQTALSLRSYRQQLLAGNTVDMNAERAQFTDNAIHYEANLTFISGQVKAMLAAIQG
jgi:flagellar basal-body rod protein FlgB